MSLSYRIRFFRIVLCSLFARPQDLLKEYNVSFFVIPFVDTDVTRMFTQTYAAFLGLARWHFVLRSTLKTVVLKKNWVPVTTSESINYKRSIKIFNRVQITTQIIFWNESRFYLKQTFLIKENIFAYAYVEGLLRGPSGHMSPPEVFKELGVKQDSPIINPEIMQLFSSK